LPHAGSKRKSEAMDVKLSVSPSPHIREGTDINTVMYAVVIAMIPASAGAVYFFGLRALTVILLAAASAVLTEAICQKAMKRRVTIADGSALVTGILLAFNVPPGVPYWLPVLGSAFAIGIAKIPFGGLGYNPLNPALAGRAFLMASWPVYMTANWIAPSRGTLSGINAITTATPLWVYKYARGLLVAPNSGMDEISRATSYLNELYSASSLKNLFLGNVGGCVGETSALLLLVGAAYLFIRRIITWRIPVSYIATVALLTWILGGKAAFTGNPLFQILSGGLILGAFFMATDMVTSPITPRGQLIFGFGCGLLTSIIRIKGGYPEGVSYSILIMNITVPLIDRYTRPRRLGEVGAKR
jgi:electron transport complex protein RnfD